MAGESGTWKMGERNEGVVDFETRRNVGRSLECLRFLEGNAGKRYQTLNVETKAEGHYRLYLSQGLNATLKFLLAQEGRRNHGGNNSYFLALRVEFLQPHSNDNNYLVTQPNLRKAPSFGVSLQICQHLSERLPLNFFLHLLGEEKKLFISGYSLAASVAAHFAVRLLDATNGSRLIQAHLFSTIPCVDLDYRRCIEDRGWSSRLLNFYTKKNSFPATAGLLLFAMNVPSTKEVAFNIWRAMNATCVGVTPAHQGHIPTLATLQSQLGNQKFHVPGLVLNFGEVSCTLDDLPSPSINSYDLPISDRRWNPSSDFIPPHALNEWRPWPMIPGVTMTVAVEVAYGITSVFIYGDHLGFIQSLRFDEKSPGITQFEANPNKVCFTAQLALGSIGGTIFITHPFQIGELLLPEVPFVRIVSLIDFSSLSEPFLPYSNFAHLLTVFFFDQSRCIPDDRKRFSSNSPWELLEKGWMFLMYSDRKNEEVLTSVNKLLSFVPFIALFELCCGSPFYCPQVISILSHLSYDQFCEFGASVKVQPQRPLELMDQLGRLISSVSLDQSGTVSNNCFCLLIYLSLIFLPDTKLTKQNYDAYVVSSLLQQTDISSEVENLWEISKKEVQLASSASNTSSTRKEPLKITSLFALERSLQEFKTRVQIIKARRGTGVDTALLQDAVMEVMDAVSEFGEFLAALLFLEMERPWNVQVKWSRDPEVENDWLRAYLPFVSSSIEKRWPQLSKYSRDSAKNLLTYSQPVLPIMFPLVRSGSLVPHQVDSFWIPSYQAKLYHIVMSLDIRNFVPGNEGNYYWYEHDILNAVREKQNDLDPIVGVFSIVEDNSQVHTLLNWIRATDTLRSQLSKTRAIGVVGARRMGKSTLCKKLWNLDVLCGALLDYSTIDVSFFPVPQCTDLCVIDYPGFNETNAMVRHRNSLSWEFASMFIVVVHCESLGNEDENYCIEIAKKGFPVLVCLNKADEVLSRVLTETNRPEKPARRMKKQLEAMKGKEMKGLMPYRNVDLILTAINPSVLPSMDLSSYSINDIEDIRLWILSKLIEQRAPQFTLVDASKPIINAYVKTLEGTTLYDFFTRLKATNTPAFSILWQSLVTPTTEFDYLLSTLSKLFYGTPKYRTSLVNLVRSYIHTRMFDTIGDPKFPYVIDLHQVSCNSCSIFPILGQTLTCHQCHYNRCSKCNSEATSEHEHDLHPRTPVPKRRCILSIERNIPRILRRQDPMRQDPIPDDLVLLSLAPVLGVSFILFNVDSGTVTPYEGLPFAVSSDTPGSQTQTQQSVPVLLIKKGHVFGSRALRPGESLIELIVKASSPESRVALGESPGQQPPTPTIIDEPLKRLSKSGESRVSPLSSKKKPGPRTLTLHIAIDEGYFKTHKEKVDIALQIGHKLSREVNPPQLDLNGFLLLDDKENSRITVELCTGAPGASQSPRDQPSGTNVFGRVLWCIFNSSTTPPVMHGVLDMRTIAASLPFGLGGLLEEGQGLELIVEVLRSLSFIEKLRPSNQKQLVADLHKLYLN